MMQFKIKTIPAKKLIGISQDMSLIEDKTFLLFRTFMSHKKEIANTIGSGVLDLKIYSSDYFSSFNPNNIFTKWALVEVSDFDQVPLGMKSFILTAGSYAVFKYHDDPHNKSPYDYIFREWLPGSNYELDDRPHFDVLGVTEEEQEIWIPVREKINREL